MIYVAQGYSGYEAISFDRACAYMKDRMLTHFSPIMYCHPIARKLGLPGNYEFWEEMDKRWIDRCESVEVLGYHGWSDSTGVARETEYAEATGKKVVIVSMDTEFYVTFGQNQAHHLNGIDLDSDVVARFTAKSLGRAREHAFHLFGGSWHQCLVYEGEEEILKYWTGSIKI